MIGQFGKLTKLILQSNKIEKNDYSQGFSVLNSLFTYVERNFLKPLSTIIEASSYRHSSSARLIRADGIACYRFVSVCVCVFLHAAHVLYRLVIAHSRVRLHVPLSPQQKRKKTVRKHDGKHDG